LRALRESGSAGFVADGRQLPHNLEWDEAPPCGSDHEFRQSNKSNTLPQAFIALKS